MATAVAPSFEVVARALRRLGVTDGPTSAHGSLCGLACVLGARARGVWVAGLAGTDGAADDGSAGVLGDLASATCAALADGEMSFMPMLPPDDAPLPARAEGLAEWCSGFMHGLGEAAGSGAVGAALDGALTREIMGDFAEIARVTLGDDESDLEAEAAYTELVEFVRVSVQLVFEELHELRQGMAGASLH
jgi:uncharacterized protein YgfB (UPF0149 family)